MPYLVLFTSSTILECSQNRKAFRYPHKRSYKKPNLANVKARKFGLLLLPNGLKAFGLCITVHQPYNEKEHQAVELSRLPDSFKVMEKHSIEASFGSSVP